MELLLLVLLAWIRAGTGQMIRPVAVPHEEMLHKPRHPVSQLLDKLLLKYDRRLRPHYGGPPVVVNVTMNIDSVGPISEVDMNFRIDISFRQYWVDKRLVFNETEEITELNVNSNFLGNIWQPDTYFPDSYESKKQDVMVPNILLRIEPSGRVLYSARVTVIAKCPMNLMYFPMDIQECSLMVETFGYTSKDLILRWKDDDPEHRPVEFNRQKLELAQFQLINLVTKQYFLVFSTGNFSDLEVVFYFKRDLIYFIIQTYVPATLIVLLSWVNFYVNRHSVPARASLAITTVLTMITLMGATNSNLPRVSSIKALDIYFGICFLYVFGALVEFALVCYFNKPRYQPKPPVPPHERNPEPSSIGVPWRREMRMKNSLVVESPNYTQNEFPPTSTSPLLRKVNSAAGSEMMTHTPLTPSGSTARNPFELQLTPTVIPMLYQPVESDPPPDPQRASQRKRKSKRRRHVPRQRSIEVSRIDLYSRIMFPLTYIMICLVYWMVYLGVTNLQDNTANGPQENEI